MERAGRRPLFWGGYGCMTASWVFVTVTLNLKVNLLPLKTDTNLAMCEDSCFKGSVHPNDENKYISFPLILSFKVTGPFNVKVKHC